MNATTPRITHELRQINAAAAQDAAALIAREEARYDGHIDAAAAHIAAHLNGCLPVMLCGPSSVGKTTTARRLCAALAARGIDAYTVSLDDFYRGVGKAPQLPDGSFDYESPEALDLDRLHACMAELITTRETRLPRYDFEAGKPSENTSWLYVPGDAVVIFEGIHAFSPLVNAGFDATDVTPVRVFVNTVGRFSRDGERVLSRRDVRLCRRLLRDERTRASSFANTLAMWPQVMAGEERYIFPYADTADCIIDTTMGYEPGLLAPLLLPRLKQAEHSRFADAAERLEDVFASCVPFSPDLIPDDSVVREFVGHGRAST